MYPELMTSMGRSALPEVSIPEASEPVTCEYFQNLIQQSQDYFPVQIDAETFNALICDVICECGASPRSLKL
jgi:hypothetical protein